MAILFENNTTGDTGYSSVDADSWRAQTFTPSIAHIITSVKITGQSHGTPGILTISIQAVNGAGKPDGTDLTSGTTDGDTFPTVGHEEREISLTSYALYANVEYAIVVKALNAVTPNDFYWRGGGTDYARGKGWYTDDSGSTWIDHEMDFLFKEYGIKRGESAGVIAVVETRFHYVDASGTERYIQGAAI